MDPATLWTAIGAVSAIIGTMYVFLYNFKKDIKEDIKDLRNGMNEKFSKVDQKFDQVHKRFDKMDEKLIHMDRRICFFEGERYNEEKHHKVK